MGLVKTSSYKGPYIYDIQQMGMGGGGQVKNGKSSDGSGWLQGGGEGDPQKLDVHFYN